MLLTFGLTLAQLYLFPPLAPAWQDLLLWVFGVVALEYSTRPLPYWNWGRFSLQMAWSIVSLGQLQQPSSTPLLALACAALIIHLRTPRRSEFLADLLGLQVLAPALTLTPFLTRPLSWALLSVAALTIQTQVLRSLARQARDGNLSSWMRLELNLVGQRWAAWWVASGALWVVGPPWIKVLWLPGLLGLAWGVQNAAFRLQAELFARLQDELRLALKEREVSQRSAHNLARFNLLRQELDRCQDAPALAQAWFGWLGDEFPVRSLAIYGPQQQCLSVVSPQSAHFENLSIWGGDRDLQGERLPRILARPWAKGELQPLLLPCGDCWIYLGLAQGNWTSANFVLLASCLEVIGPKLDILLTQLGTTQKLDELGQHSVALQETILSQQFLLHCADRFLRPLQLETLWTELQACLGQVLSLHSLCWLEQSSPQAQWGPPPTAELVGWAGRLQGTGYLAYADRDRWPVKNLPLENVVALPCADLGTLVVAFRGDWSLQPGQVKALQGLAHLFAGSVVRVKLHLQLETSRELWLKSQKSLAQAQLAAGLAHELNSPLGAIQLALEATLLRQHSDRLQTALDACQRSRAIIQRLQSLSEQQLEANENLDIVQILHALVQQLPQKPEPLNWQGPPTLLVQAPRNLLEQALLPLLNNAVEAGGGVTLTWGQSAGSAWIRVADQGPGIPIEIRSRLGELFFTTKEIGKNLGLGLASVDQACRLMGGSWEIESPSRGASICLKLPLPVSAGQRPEPRH